MHVRARVRLEFIVPIRRIQFHARRGHTLVSYFWYASNPSSFLLNLFGSHTFIQSPPGARRGMKKKLLFKERGKFPGSSNGVEFYGYGCHWYFSGALEAWKENTICGGYRRLNTLWFIYILLFFSQGPKRCHVLVKFGVVRRGKVFEGKTQLWSKLSRFYGGKHVSSLNTRLSEAK
jgi:hypothetical protein